MISARTRHETGRPHLHRNLTADIVYTSTLDTKKTQYDTQSDGQVWLRDTTDTSTDRGLH